jgi:hypothetical protein
MLRPCGQLSRNVSRPSIPEMLRGQMLCYRTILLHLNLSRHWLKTVGPRGISRQPAWFETWDGPVKVEISDLNIVAEARVAFAHALHRLSGKRANGTATNFWLRSTLCFRKRAGRWAIVHSHSSVPFHLIEGFPAALDLQP